MYLAWSIICQKRVKNHNFLKPKDDIFRHLVLSDQHYSVYDDFFLLKQQIQAFEKLNLSPENDINK